MTEPTPTLRRLRLPCEPLTAAAFKPFGDVIEASSAAHHWPVNEGFAERFHDLAQLDTQAEGGRPLLSLFRARPCGLPLQLRLLERHRLGSQAFVPLGAQRFLVVVAPARPLPREDDVRCFLTAPGQGINYARGTWHHPLLALDGGGDFLVIDRGGPGAATDCEVHALDPTGLWVDT